MRFEGFVSTILGPHWDNVETNIRCFALHLITSPSSQFFRSLNVSDESIGGMIGFSLQPTHTIALVTGATTQQAVYYRCSLGLPIITIGRKDSIS